jgi:hypothetical protein
VGQIRHRQSEGGDAMSENPALALVDAAIARADAAEAREWALGVQVVAQAARLKLAEAVVDEARYGQPTLAMRAALDAWDTVPGMEP